MSLSPKDFTNDFIDGEIIPLTLTTMNGKKVFVRSLSRFHKTKFRVLADKIRIRSSLSLLSQDEDSGDIHKDPIKPEDLDNAEDWLVMKSLCHEDGSLFFNDLDTYIQWSKSVRDEVIEEILHLIAEKQSIFITNEELDEDLKKK